MKRMIGLLALILSLGFAFPHIAFADADNGDELSVVERLDSAAPVRNMMLLRSSRFEIQPLAAFGINETFHQSVGFGAQAAYYFTNYIGVVADFSFNPFRLTRDEIDRVKGKRYDADVKNSLAIAAPQMHFDLGVVYAPMIGKFSLFGWILNYDLHLFAGFGGLYMTSYCASGGSGCNEVKDKSIEGIKFAGALGLGTRIFFNNFIALNIEYRAFLTKFAEFSRTENDANSKFNVAHFASFGFSIFLPTSVYLSK